MGKIVKGYKVRSQIEFGKIQNQINELKDKFNSTDWDDESKMIQAANEIWRLENKLKCALEIHDIIVGLEG